VRLKAAIVTPRERSSVKSACVHRGVVQSGKSRHEGHVSLDERIAERLVDVAEGRMVFDEQLVDAVENGEVKASHVAQRHGRERNRFGHKLNCHLYTVIHAAVYIRYIIIIITTIKGIYIAQVRKGHKCATSAQMAVWLSNRVCLYSYLHN